MTPLILSQKKWRYALLCPSSVRLTQNLVLIGHSTPILPDFCWSIHDFSALMHAVVFGNVTAIIQRMYARRFSYDLQANELKDFYRIYNIPKPLKNKIREFYQTVWTVRRGIKHEKVSPPLVQHFPVLSFLVFFTDFL